MKFPSLVRRVTTMAVVDGDQASPATPANRPSRARLTRKRRNLLASAAMLGIAVTAISVVGTNALYNDQATTPGNAFTTGTLNLTTTPTSGFLAMTNGYPGASVVAPLTVRNAGSLEMRYAITATPSGALAPMLGLQVKAGVASCTEAGFAASGTNVYGPATMPVATETAIAGDKARGWHNGDRVLAGGASETLCFRILEDTAAGNQYQGSSGQFSFTFIAEQTKNNQWADGDSYLVNKGFESTTLTDNLVGYWGTPLTYTTTQQRLGARALQFTTTTANNYQGFIVGPLPHKAVPAGTYVFESLWFKAPAGTTWVLEGRLHTPDGGYLSEGQASRVVTATGEWQYASIGWAGPTDQPFMPMFQMRTADTTAKNQNVTVYVDDVHITPQNR